MSASTDGLRERLGDHAARFIDANGVHGDAAITARIDRVARWLDSRGLQRVASRIDNGTDWFVLDLALQQVGGVHVPLPTFFSNGQVLHAISSSGAQCVVTGRGGGIPAGTEALAGFLESGTLECWRTAPQDMPVLPTGTSCITFTSGTTGTAKGVCLGTPALLQVAGSLVEASSSIAPRRHLCLMPLATLLENVAGLYATLLADAQIALPSLAEVGYSGASGLDVPTLLRCLHRYQPESVILVPQLLLALVMAAEHGHALPRSLRYIAVGGGRVAPALLARARALGLPVFEGYGLTECASVVCLNRPDRQRDGSVGQALPHARVSVDDGELLVEGGATLLGYLDEGARAAGPVRTGDLGHVDADGFVHVTGRRRNMFITAFGRNVSPEWVESEVTAHPLLGQAVVWGEGQADNVAVVVPRREADDAGVARALAEVNAGLPDYARVARFVRAAAPFSAADGLMTANGRPRRAEILARYQAQIDACYRLPPSVPHAGIVP